MTSFILSVSNNQVVARDTSAIVEGHDDIIGSVDEYNEWIDGVIAECGDEYEIFHSSTIDFAHEETDNAAVIELCQALTGK